MKLLKKSALGLTVLGGLAAAVLGAPGTALAGGSALPSGGTVQVVNNKILYKGTDAKNHIVAITGLNNTIMLAEENPAVGITAGPGCQQVGEEYARCPKMLLEVNLGGGGDIFTVGGPSPFGVLTVVNGGSGDDTYRGGRDLAASNVTFHGGVGSDTADYSLATDRVAVNLNNSSGDGRPAKQDEDDIKNDVENLIGSDFPDYLVGNDNKNTITGGKGADLMYGGAGDDTLITFNKGPGGQVIPEADSMISCFDGIDTALTDTADPAPSACENHEVVS